MTKSIHPYEILRRPIITEKSTILSAQGKYVFEVHREANKNQIKTAVEQLFNVTVTAVNTSNERGRRPRTRYGKRAGNPPTYKKAIVTLGSGEQIEFFEGA